MGWSISAPPSGCRGRRRITAGSPVPRFRRARLRRDAESRQKRCSTLGSGSRPGLQCARRGGVSEALLEAYRRRAGRDGCFRLQMRATMRGRAGAEPNPCPETTRSPLLGIPRQYPRRRPRIPRTTPALDDRFALDRQVDERFEHKPRASFRGGNHAPVDLGRMTREALLPGAPRMNGARAPVARLECPR